MVNDWRYARAGTQYPAGVGFATILPDFDFETYSEAGLVWDSLAQKWDSLPGISNQNRGLKGVGARKYVEHPSFEVLSLSWNLKDGNGVQWWRPELAIPYKHYPRYDSNWRNNCGFVSTLHPWTLLEYVAAGGMLEAHNVNFEWTVWNIHCVPMLGWPPFHCDAQGLPPL